MKGKALNKPPKKFHGYSLRAPEGLWKEFAEMAKGAHRSINSEIILAMRDRLRKKKGDVT